MSHRNHRLLTAFLIALHHPLVLASDPQDPNRAPAACPAPAEVGQVQLLGTWLARFDGGPDTAVLRLVPSPRHADGVSGTVERPGGQPPTAQVAGDVDDGDFTLEESVDGRQIAATWTGRVMEDTCGKEIRGQWRRASDPDTRTFVLRRQAGWD